MNPPPVYLQYTLRSNRLKIAAQAGWMLLLGAIVGWSPAQAIWQADAPLTELDTILLLLALYFFVLVATTLTAAATGLPSLSVNATGVTTTALFRTRHADWSSLGAFHVIPVEFMRFRRPAVAALAPIIGAGVSRNLRRRRHLLIPDVFEKPAEVIAAQLNAHPLHRQSTPNVAAPSFSGAPWLTYGLTAMLLAIFALQQVFAIEPSGELLRPAPLALVALGGLTRELVASGEWYRLLTAPFLHGNLLHVAVNCIALLMAGLVLERLAGRAWFLALFLFSAAGGSLASIAINPPNVVACGASGAAMGLFAATLITSFRLPRSIARARLQIRSGYILLFSILPLDVALNDLRIDYACHFGGALAGVLLSLLLVSRLPAKFVWSISAAGLMLLALGLAEVARGYADYRLQAALIPQDRLAYTQEDMDRRGAELVARYPLDPRAYYYRGASLLEAREFAAAAAQFRTALRLFPPARPYTSKQFESMIHTMLAAALLQQGQSAEAHKAAQFACHAPSETQPPPAMQRWLVDRHLCD